MLLLLHVLSALASIVWTGFSFFSPSLSKLHVSYTLIVGTLVTGTYLVETTHSPMLQSCLAGVAYLVIVLAETFGVRSRLAKARAQ